MSDITFSTEKDFESLMETHDAADERHYLNYASLIKEDPEKGDSIYRDIGVPKGKVGLMLTGVLVNREDAPPMRINKFKKTTKSVAKVTDCQTPLTIMFKEHPEVKWTYWFGLKSIMAARNECINKHYTEMETHFSKAHAKLMEILHIGDGNFDKSKDITVYVRGVNENEVEVLFVDEKLPRDKVLFAYRANGLDSMLSRTRIHNKDLGRFMSSMSAELRKDFPDAYEEV